MKTVYDYFWEDVKDKEEVDIDIDYDIDENRLTYSYLEWCDNLNDYKLVVKSWKLNKDKYNKLKSIYNNLVLTNGKTYAKENLDCIKI